MDLYAQLNLSPVKSEPNVWVRRVVIYERLMPEPVVIRDIPLTRGLNIVWAEEPDSDDPKAEIAGHSAGKTTFCRFFRYLLGETTYSTKANSEMIRRSFPEGYVAGELVIRGQLISVLRPIGSARASYFHVGGGVEQLLKERSKPVNQADYPKAVGLEALLDSLEAGAVARTSEPIRWGHILAWCARDQEARFQSVHEWRSPRSESEWPAFRFSRSDPLFVMRTVLGLFSPDELRDEEELAGLERTREALEARLEELKREPKYRVNLYEESLRDQLRDLLPSEQNISALSAQSDDHALERERVIGKAIRHATDALSVLEDKRSSLQQQIDTEGGAINRLEERAGQLDDLFDLQQSALTETSTALAQGRRERDLFDSHAGARCILGGVLYRDCSYVQERQRHVRLTIVQDAHTMEQAEAKRAAILEGVQADRADIETQLGAARTRRQQLQTERDAISAGIRDNREALRRIADTREQLRVWAAFQSAPHEFVALTECQDRLRSTTAKIHALEARLSALLAEHASNRQQLASIFSGAVRAVLASGTYDGTVDFANRELTFRITHGTAMSGEAVETLSVLLADLACAVYSTVSERVRLPGLVLHDSPREADLGGRIYRGFIRLVADLNRHFASPDSCPFQYILTTTTPPPDEVRAHAVKLKLNAASEDGLLLRRNVARIQIPQGSLFAVEPE